MKRVSDCILDSALVLRQVAPEFVPDTGSNRNRRWEGMTTTLLLTACCYLKIVIDFRCTDSSQTLQKWEKHALPHKLYTLSRCKQTNFDEISKNFAITQMATKHRVGLNLVFGRYSIELHLVLVWTFRYDLTARHWPQCIPYIKMTGTYFNLLHVVKRNN